jgi:hypothetical protein
MFRGDTADDLDEARSLDDLRDKRLSGGLEAMAALRA